MRTHGDGPLVIVGDALLDTDMDGDASRLCPDAPAPVLDQRSVRSRPGGAALAALLAATAGSDEREVTLIAPFGDDQASDAVLDMMPAGATTIRLPLDGAAQLSGRVVTVPYLAGRSTTRILELGRS